MDICAKKQTILIVDDVTTNIDILAELLRPDYKIRAATSGEKALKISFSENPPDLILLDVMMPDIDGYDVCRILKESSQTKDIPIIFITGKTSIEDEIYGFNLGAVDYVRKPFNSIIVKARVNTHAELKRYHDYLKEISYLDGLTGIANRRKFDEYLDITWNFAMREATPISMVLIDIDNFKLFNDHYGHQEGDDCLIQIAQTLAGGATRKTELVARYGGEEFVCILPNTEMKDAKQIAEKFRRSIMSIQIPHQYSATGSEVTISIGVATIIPEFNSNCSLLIKASDEALYRAKASGRNQVQT
jgi:diguanylate cyclase (GGDEF)-like protein